jgi:hypothetical protein
MPGETPPKHKPSPVIVPVGKSSDVVVPSQTAPSGPSSGTAVLPQDAPTSGSGGLVDHPQIIP